MKEAVIAVNRFGLGAGPDEAMPADARDHLLAQFARYEAAPAALAQQPRSGEVVAAYLRYQAARREARQAGSRQDEAPRDTRRELHVAAVGARINAALATPAPFVERLVHFWSNHFAVSIDKGLLVGLAGPFEFEAIRPYVLGNFRELLLAVERHPAMLLYLDQAQSVGPASPLAVATQQRGSTRRMGLNENLAREILELHTLGVRSGYGQQDVIELARAMTGWTVAGIGRAARDTESGQLTLFAARLHEPGIRTLLGKRYVQPDEMQSAAMLADLAVHPATARHVAGKLVRHFIADDAPASAVRRCEKAFLRSGGDLPTVYRALIGSSEAWSPAARKFKTPWDWQLSALRALGLRAVTARQGSSLATQLGQPVWRPGQPAGWDDTTGSWAGPDAILRRVEAAQRLARGTAAGLDARTLAERFFAGTLSQTTRRVLAGAESPAQALALLLVAPEFMRR